MPKFNELDSAVKRDILHVLLTRMATRSELKTAAERTASYNGTSAKVVAWIQEHDGDMSPHDWLCLASEIRRSQ